MTITTITSNVVTTLGLVGVAAFFYSKRRNLIQFQFSVMLSCVERFQKLFPELLGKEKDIWRIREYIDLANEELFYFQRGYIPKEVIVEWLDGMLLYLPVYVLGSALPVNYELLPYPEIHDQKLLAGYPRLKKAFKIESALLSKELGGKLTGELKRKVIKEIAKNLGVILSDKHFKEAMILDEVGNLNSRQN